MVWRPKDGGNPGPVSTLLSLQRDAHVLRLDLVWLWNSGCRLGVVTWHLLKHHAAFPGRHLGSKNQSSCGGASTPSVLMAACVSSAALVPLEVLASCDPWLVPLWNCISFWFASLAKHVNDFAIPLRPSRQCTLLEIWVLVGACGLITHLLAPRRKQWALIFMVFGTVPLGGVILNFCIGWKVAGMPLYNGFL